MEKITSELYRLNKEDWFQGLKIAIGGAIADSVLSIVTSLQSTHKLTFDVKQIGTSAAIAGVVYLVHRFLTPSQKVSPI